MHECKACSISFDKYVPHSLIHFVVTWTGATQIVLIFSVRRLLAYSISPWMTPWKRLPYKLTGPLEQPKQNLSRLCHWCGFVAGTGLIIIIMISFQTEHRTIFLFQRTGFPLHKAVKVNVLNTIWALHISITLSTTVTLAETIRSGMQEWVLLINIAVFT